MLEVQERDTAGEYLSGLMALVVRASPGPFTVTPAPRGRWQIVSASNSATIATARRRTDADLLASALPAIRALSSAAAAVLQQHAPSGDGVCRACSQPAPCATRQVIEHELAPHPGGTA